MKKFYLRWLPAVLFVSLLWGCKAGGDIQGKYLAEAKDDPPPVSIKLELGANGQGSWAMKGERVYFKWENQGKEVWLHTKSGGVVVGRILEKGIIEFNLPGAGSLSFKKTSN